MKTLASISLGALLLVTACAQPQARAPQAPPPPPPPMPCACDAMGGEHPGPDRMAMMHHEMGPMRGEQMPRMRMRAMGRGARGGDRAVMRELAGLGVRFYPPPMLLRRSADIGLTPDQIAKIRREVLGAQARSVELRAKVQKARVEAMRLLTADKVDERAVGSQIDEAAKARAELRKLQLGVMVHVRALLTPEQIKKIEELKPPMLRGGPGAGPGKQAVDDEDDAPDDDDAGG
jgi:Spy/CpxP family protein refolding chaperone